MYDVPIDFNWQEYLKLNPDAARFYYTEDGAQKHWTLYGKAQNRQYRIDTLPSVRPDRTNSKLRILLLPDSPNWAFDNIASAIIKYNPYPDKIEYEKSFTSQTSSYVNYNAWDYVYIMFEGNSSIHTGEKTIRGCYSSYWLENQAYTPEHIASIFNQSKGAIFVNEKIKNEILPHLTIECTVIPDAADPLKFYPLSTKSKNFTVLFVGNTARKLKNFIDIQDICKEADVDLILAENIPHEKLIHEYAKADICINFSDSEGGPQTFPESALCGIPMLIRDNNEFSKLIPCYTGKTKTDFVKILKYLKKNRKECARKGKSAREFVLQNFTYEKIAKQYADFFLKFADEIVDDNPITDITAFVIRAGENPNYEDCIAALKRQTIKCNIQEIRDIAPMSLAFQQMIDTCKTKYYVQVDEDMILKPNAIKIMYEAMKKQDSKVAMITHLLHDVHLNFDICGVKIYNHDILKQYPYNLNIISCEVEQFERMEKAGYRIASYDTVIGDHSPKWKDSIIFERYFDLMEKWKVYKYGWLESVPSKLLEIYRKDSSDINLFALLGAITSIINPEQIRKREKNFKIQDPNFQILSKWFKR